MLTLSADRACYLLVQVSSLLWSTDICPMTFRLLRSLVLVLHTQDILCFLRPACFLKMKRLLSPESEVWAESQVCKRDYSSVADLIIMTFVMNRVVGLTEVGFRQEKHFGLKKDRSFGDDFQPAYGANKISRLFSLTEHNMVTLRHTDVKGSSLTHTHSMCSV